MLDLVEPRLAVLPTLSKAALGDLWKQTFGSLSARAQQRLLDLSRAFEKGSDAAFARAPRIHPGTRLVRQWGDRVHLVNVESNGYEYQGARYQSLSEIARLITGTRWSGPLFFGIKNQQSKETQLTAILDG